MRYLVAFFGSLLHGACIVLLFAGLASGPDAKAAVPDLDLGGYTLAGTYALPTAASEASAVTWNWDTDTLFVLGDEGDSLVEVDKTGSLLNTMTLTDFDDTEAMTYVGAGQFVVVEERLQNAYLLTWVGGGTVSRSALPAVSLGPTIGNVGLEGIAFDQVAGEFVVVKEKTPLQVRAGGIDFTANTNSLTDLFTPVLGVTDLADVQTLSNVPALIGGPDSDNLLILSQETQILQEVSRTGSVLSSFDFSPFSNNAEGVTIDDDGVIYVVSENPSLYVLQPLAVPEPTTGLLLAAGSLFLLVGRRRTFG